MIQMAEIVKHKLDARVHEMKVIYEVDNNMKIGTLVKEGDKWLITHSKNVTLDVTDQPLFIIVGVVGKVTSGMEMKIPFGAKHWKKIIHHKLFGKKVPINIFLAASLLRRADYKNPLLEQFDDNTMFGEPE